MSGFAVKSADQGGAANVSPILATFTLLRSADMTELHLNRQSAPQKHRGAWAEMVACVWLLQQGYEVFRNVSPHGGTDIVAIRGAEVLRFDVKSYTDGKALASRTAEQIALGVRFLVIRDDGTVSVSDGAPPVPATIECRHCGVSFAPRHKSQKLCRRDCSPAKPTAKPCLQCSTEFTPQSKRGKYCSTECAREHWKRVTSEHASRTKPLERH